MASPPIPTDAELYWPQLKAIEALGGSGTISEIEAKVAELQGFSEEQLAVLHKDGPLTEIYYRLAWARTYLKAAGALDNSTRGVWSINDEGRRLTEADMRDVLVRARSALRESRRSRRAESHPDPEEDGEDQDADWRAQLLESLQTMSPPHSSDSPNGSCVRQAS